MVFTSSYTGSLLLLRGFSLAVGNGGYSLVVVHRLLTVMTSPAVKHGLQGVRAQGCHMCVLGSCGSRAVECRLSGCGTQAELLWRMWHLPGPGIEPVCPDWQTDWQTDSLPLGPQGSHIFEPLNTELGQLQPSVSNLARHLPLACLRVSLLRMA